MEGKSESTKGSLFFPIMLTLAVIAAGLIFAGRSGDQSTTPQTADAVVTKPHMATFVVSWLTAEVPANQEFKLKVAYTIGDKTTAASVPLAAIPSRDQKSRSWSLSIPYRAGQSLGVDIRSEGLSANLAAGIQVDFRAVECASKSKPAARSHAYCHIAG